MTCPICAGEIRGGGLICASCRASALLNEMDQLMSGHVADRRYPLVLRTFREMAPAVARALT